MSPQESHTVAAALYASMYAGDDYNLAHSQMEAGFEPLLPEEDSEDMESASTTTLIKIIESSVPLPKGFADELYSEVLDDPGVPLPQVFAIETAPGILDVPALPPIPIPGILAGPTLQTTGEEDTASEDEVDLDNEDQDPTYIPDTDVPITRANVDNGDENEARDPTFITDDDVPTRANVEDGAETAEPPKKKMRKEIPTIKDPCNETCNKKCTTKVSQQQRERIHSEYTALTYNSRRAMIFNHVTRKDKARTTKHATDERKRNYSYEYRLPNSDGEMQQVCKTFFLGTLGYHPKNDRIVVTVFQTTPTSAVTVTNDRRGRHYNRPHRMNVEDVSAHVESFNPCISHYRREHAPKRRYLPSDISIKSMYEDYISHEPEKPITYQSYRKIVNDKNISFAKLGEEECEKCVKQEEHLKDEHGITLKTRQEMTSVTGCNGQCKMYALHKIRYQLGRTKYRSDAKKDWGRESLALSVDLQKVIMLPRMPGNKTAVFTKRIVAYHETFSPLGSKADKKNTVSVIWHEGIAKRNAEEITSAFVCAFQKERDIMHFIVWLDNCTAQNKNWCLFSSMVILINSDTIMAEDITFKFFEPGHTFMSADSFHHGVESQMRKCKGGNVYDFPDFGKVIQESNGGKVTVVEMANNNFLAFKSGHSAYRVKKLDVATFLSNMVVVQFRRGSQKLHVKESHDQEEFREVEFLKKNFQLEMPGPLRAQNRGIPEIKKADIVEKLCHLMPAPRRGFWMNLDIGLDDDETV